MWTDDGCGAGSNWSELFSSAASEELDLRIIELRPSPLYLSKEQLESGLCVTLRYRNGEPPSRTSYVTSSQI